MAAEWMGWENIFHCEWNPFGQRVLKHYWPNAKSYEDITKTDFTIHRGSIDILTGGFPCQPYSMAGKRKGKADERHLWPQMLRAIREIAPSYIVGENVLGLVNWDGGMVFDEVQADLESAGYEVATVVIPAAAVNAPHGRDRVWFVAYRNNTGNTTPRCGIERNRTEESEERKYSQPKFNGHGVDGDVANTSIKGLEGRIERSVFEWKQEEREIWGNGSGRCQKNNWDNFPTQSPICGGDDGLPRQLDGITFSKWRNESIKGYGNAIVPQVAFEIFKVIQKIETQP